MNVRALNLSLPDLQRAYEAGVSVAEVMCEVMRRADAYATLDDAVWIARLCESHVLGFAEALDSLSPEERAAKPLFGVPFAIKDNIDLKGVPTTAACPGFAYTPDESAAIVSALIEAGAVPVGKTNLDQFATGLNGTRSPFGAPRCVFNSDVISGGSSSGSAIAVAAGIVSFALGTDTAGSGRVPAALNGLIGLKPSPRLCSTKGIVPACASLDCPSVFALTIEDALMVLEAMAHPAAAKPLTQNGATLGVLSEKDREFFGDTEAAALYAAALAHAQACGHTLTEIDYAPLAEAAALLYDGPFVVERYQAVGLAIEAKPDGLDPTVAGIILGGKSVTDAALAAGTARLQQLQAIANKMFETIDAALLPTTPLAPTIDAMLADPVGLNSKLGTYTNFVNLLGMAAIAIPAGARESNGVPFGVTLMGPGGTDRALAALAQSLCAAPPSGLKDGEMEVAVVGAHLRGQPLNVQLTEKGGRFLKQTLSAPTYRLYALPTTPPKPALVNSASGQPIELEVWALPKAELGAFLLEIPAPLGLGTVTLIDGRSVKGFIAEPRALDTGTDITDLKRWRSFVAK